jgi:hypothetical protein
MVDLKFEEGDRNYKYKVTITLKNGVSRIVQFGDKRYQHYKDKIGLFTHLDHNDPVRRRSYRIRHGSIKLKNGRRAIDVKYSPAWFSWHFLW